MSFTTNRYRCECGHRWDEFQERDERAAVCPRCGGPGEWVFPCPLVVGTDREYHQGKGSLLTQLGEHDLKYRLKQARKHGFTPGKNDVYEPLLARFPGDPKAWIGGGLSQYKRRCKEMASQGRHKFDADSKKLETAGKES